MTDISKGTHPLTFLTGKSSVGKTSLARKLKNQGYGLVELDLIVRKEKTLPIWSKDQMELVKDYRKNGIKGSIVTDFLEKRVS